MIGTAHLYNAARTMRMLMAHMCSAIGNERFLQTVPIQTVHSHLNCGGILHEIFCTCVQVKFPSGVCALAAEVAGRRLSLLTVNISDKSSEAMIGSTFSVTLSLLIGVALSLFQRRRCFFRSFMFYSQTPVGGIAGTIG
jgi:hypothetical protein